MVRLKFEGQMRLGWDRMIELLSWGGEQVQVTMRTRAS